jgi:hypothetical protein
MSRYELSLNGAKKLQKWALEVSEAKKFLDTIPKFKSGKKKPGLYVDYEIDESELEDDGLDYSTPEVARVLAVDKKGKETLIGTISAYNWESYWLDIGGEMQVDTAKNWWELINEEYKKMLND